jgi:hypothetical protein
VRTCDDGLTTALVGRPQVVVVAEPVKLGIPGLSVSRGTHLCAFFRGSGERDSIGDLFTEVVKIHSGVFMGSTVLESLYYVPPGELVVGQW